MANWTLPTWGHVMLGIVGAQLFMCVLRLLGLKC